MAEIKPIQIFAAGAGRLPQAQLELRFGLSLAIHPLVMMICTSFKGCLLERERDKGKLGFSQKGSWLWCTIKYCLTLNNDFFRFSELRNAV